jgi:hypothetical protein
MKPLKIKSEKEAGASVILRNVSKDDYVVAELGGVLVAKNDTIDLMDDTLPAFYDNWEAANALVAYENSSQLWSDIQAGLLEVVEVKKPKKQMVEF